MEGMRFTRNIQNTRSFGKFLAGNPTRLPASVACADRAYALSGNKKVNQKLLSG